MLKYLCCDFRRRIYIRKTLQEKAINWQFFANPFSTYLLLSVALCFFGLIGMLWIIITIYQSQPELENIHEVSWLVLCSFCQKGTWQLETNTTLLTVLTCVQFRNPYKFVMYSLTIFIIWRVAFHTWESKWENSVCNNLRHIPHHLFFLLGNLNFTAYICTANSTSFQRFEGTFGVEKMEWWTYQRWPDSNIYGGMYSLYRSREHPE